MTATTAADPPVISSPRLSVAAACGVELLLVAFYVNQAAGYHWLVHLFAGGSVGLLAATVLVLLPRGAVSRPVPVALVAVVAGQLVAVVPDVLFALGEPHARWMDVFIGHVSAHDTPGGTWALLAVFLATLAGYLAVAVRGSLRAGSGCAKPDHRQPPEPGCHRARSPNGS